MFTIFNKINIFSSFKLANKLKLILSATLLY